MRGTSNADGSIEQGSDGRDAELRRFKYACHGFRPDVSSDQRTAAQRSAGRVRSSRQFRLDAARRARSGEGALARRIFGVGLLLLGCAGGAPFLPKLAELAKGNLPFAVGGMVLLMVVTVGFLPVALPLMLPGVTVNPWNIARSLILLMLLPLAAGLLLKARYGELASRVKPMLDWLSNISLILLVLLITAVNIDKVLQVFGTRRNPCGSSVYRIRLWDWLAAWRT